MKTPRYTDNRYPFGYRKSVDTDITKTFDRVKREQKKVEEAQAHKVQSIIRKRA